MTDKIQTRIFNYGDKNEASWPPKYARKNASGFFVYRYKDQKGNLSKSKQNPDDEYVLINVDEDDAPDPKAPFVIGDEMPPTKSMIEFDAPVFESKSAYRRHLKAHGYRETGGEHLKDVNRKPTKAETEARAAKNREMTKEALMDVKYDRIEFTEQQKELFKREKEQWGPNYNLKVRS